MCGIAGYFSLNVEKKLDVEGAIDAISHRGPDEQGFFKSQFCQMGMCRLAIIDVKRGQQPNYNSDKSIVSIFNGEIYNFKELYSLLKSRGYRIASEGDSALIPYLYEEFGSNFTEYLRGMFAIAIYDLNNQKVLLVRDRLGKKPLWYQENQGSLLFASEIKGLLKLGATKEIRTESIVEYLKFGYLNAPRSTFKSIFQLPPASTLTFSTDGIRISRYWNPSSVQEIRIDFEDAIQEAERLIKESIKLRLVSERPIGAFLSGGVDSTLVSKLMCDESLSEVHTFSIGFEESEYDESRFAKEVAKAIGTNHHEKIIKPDPVLLVDKLSSVLDQPFADSSIIPTYMLSEFARERVVVALSGDGGDEAFGGYTRYRIATLLDRINPILTFNPLRILPSSRVSNPQLRKLIKHSKRTEISTRYRGLQSFYQDVELKVLLTQDFQSNIHETSFEDMWNGIENHILFTKLQLVDVESYLPGDLLYKVDMASMANSLEVRSPLLDYKVVEFGLSLPQAFKFKGKTNKYLLRELTNRHVPRELINRPKMGFAIPIEKWVRGELREIIADTLLDHQCLNRGLFNRNYVEKLLQSQNEGGNFANLIWPLFMFELWANKWLDV